MSLNMFEIVFLQAQLALRQLAPIWTLTTILMLTVSYLLLVQFLRFRNVCQIKLIASPYSADLDKMDYKTAHRILKLTIQYEFPFTFAFGTRWALVKSYGIQGGSHLLVETRQLSSPKNVGKRTEDTATLLYEMLVSGIDSERGSKSLAKMNWLHRRYAGRIDNDGYIFTLALFVLEPMRWIELYEWRKPSQAERIAYFSYWKEIGYRMGIDGLPATLSELEAWQSKFITRRMGFDTSNKILADAFIEATLRKTPEWLHSSLKQVITCFLEPHVREALGFDSPPALLEVTVKVLLYIRGVLVRYFFVPRVQAFAEPLAPGLNGRIHREHFIVEPWYIRETAWTKIKKIFLSSFLSIPGQEFRSDGYLPEELGPARYEKISKDDVLEEATALARIGEQGGAVSMGCPFVFNK